MIDCKECKYFHLPAINDTCESCIDYSEFSRKIPENRVSRVKNKMDKEIEEKFKYLENRIMECENKILELIEDRER